jgi:hypothetical protein
VSLPEVPLLGVLPGTGGLTRVTDKRHVRHDRAEFFCTGVEGVRSQRAVDWRLVDAVVKPAQFPAALQDRAAKLAERSDRPADGTPVALRRIEREDTPDGLRYEHVSVAIDRTKRTATFTVRAPVGAQPADDAGSCFAGTLAELAFAADRAYMLALPEEAERAPTLTLNELNFGFYPIVNDQTPLACRFYEEAAAARRGARGSDEATRRRRSTCPRTRDGRARRHRLGRRDSHCDRRARSDVARGVDRLGSQPALRR